MPPKVTREQYLETVEALQKHNGNKRATARALGITPGAINNRLDSGERQFGPAADAAASFTSPVLPGVEMETEALLDHLTTRAETRKIAATARKWMEFKMNINGPYGLMFMGDPHLGDNGCEIKQLRHDMALAQDPKRPLFLVCMGDVGNFWSNRLQRLYMEQETSLQQELQLAEWYFGSRKTDGSPLWFLIIQGNHDVMLPGVGEFLQRMARGVAPCEEWRAQFTVKSPNGFQFKVWAQHDFPGGSQYSTVFAPHKKGMLTGGDADLYVQGHRHSWGLHQDEDTESGRVFWSAQARGYKILDGFARRIGYADHSYGHSITAIVDPDATGPARVKCFPDTEEAAEFLDWKRQKYNG